MRASLQIKLGTCQLSPLMMSNVLFVENLKCNLISIQSHTKKGYSILFKGDHAYVSHNGERVFEAHARGKLYEVVFDLAKNFAGISGERILILHNFYGTISWHI